MARIEAAIALGNARRDSAAAALETALKDKEVEVRIAACDALGKQANPVSVPVLQDMLTNEVERDVQLAAARALGNIPDPAAVEALAVALDQRSPALQYRAMESLRSITSEDFDGDVDQWRTYAKGDIKIDRNGPSFAKGLGQLFR